MYPQFGEDVSRDALIRSEGFSWNSLILEEFIGSCSLAALLKVFFVVSQGSQLARQPASMPSNTTPTQWCLFLFGSQAFHTDWYGTQATSCIVVEDVS